MIKNKWLHSTIWTQIALPRKLFHNTTSQPYVPYNGPLDWGLYMTSSNVDFFWIVDFVNFWCHKPLTVLWTDYCEEIKWNG